MSLSFWGDHVQDRETYGTPIRFFGVYRGIIENCSDPMGLGRVQVRVTEVNGLLHKNKKDGNDEIPTASLPWASVLSHGGGYPDTGSQQTFHCGSMVAVEFEGGNHYYPVVIGSYKYNPETPKLTAYEDPRDIWPNYTVPIGGGHIALKSACNVPAEASLLYRFTPTRNVITKSIKGHTFWYEDKDQAECMELVDRIGQGIRFESPILYSDNKKNKLCRELKTTFANYACDESPSLRIMLRDGSLNEILLERQDQDRHIKLKSSDVQLLLHGNRNRATLGHIKSNTLIDLDSNSQTTRITSKRIVLDGDVIIQGDLSVTGNARFFKIIKSYVRMVVNQINTTEK